MCSAGVSSQPLVLIDAITRLIPGALGDPEGAWDDSHATGLLEYPHYTRPPEFRGWGVPEILLSGDHARIATWRRQQALLRTRQRRPDLLEKADLSESDRDFLHSLEVDNNISYSPGIILALYFHNLYFGGWNAF